MSVMRLTMRPGASARAAADSSEVAVALARSGDHDAFRRVFDRYCRPVTSFIFDMVGQRELAEELAQETFVRAYRGLGSLRDDTKLSTWLFGIAKNVAYESIRTRRRRTMVGIEEMVDVPESDANQRPEQELLNKELSGVIQKALAALDDDKRTVFTLKIFQQKSYEEISQITGFSIPKLKTDLHRARAEMRRRIGPYLESVS
jgi:RNA polymerase sigma-70 factor (ECF subfamily)